jgi:hypothetical protein
MWEDRTLQSCVVRELEWDTAVDAANVGVSVRAGVVTLAGTVSGAVEREDVLRAVGRVYGVVRIVDALELAPGMPAADPGSPLPDSPPPTPSGATVRGAAGA